MYYLVKKFKNLYTLIKVKKRRVTVYFFLKRDTVGEKYRINGSEHGLGTVLSICRQERQMR